MDSALALFEVDGVRGEVPMDDGVAVVVEVEALLADRGGREDEGTEGGGEGFADLIGARGGAVVVALVGEASGELGEEVSAVRADGATGVAELVVDDLHLRGAELEGFTHLVRDLVDAVVDVAGREAEVIAQDVNVL